MLTVDQFKSAVSTFEKRVWIALGILASPFLVAGLVMLLFVDRLRPIILSLVPNGGMLLALLAFVFISVFIGWTGRRFKSAQAHRLGLTCPACSKELVKDLWFDRGASVIQTQNCPNCGRRVLAERGA